jgi:hypothetical protein
MDGENGTKGNKNRSRGKDGCDVTNGDEDNDERRVRKLWMVRVAHRETRRGRVKSYDSERSAKVSEDMNL